MLLGALVLAHYGYPYMALGFESDSMALEQSASWSFYILRGIEGVVLFWLLLQHPQGRGLWLKVWVIVCWLGMFEEGQTAVCGLIADPHVSIPLWSGLCIEQFGTFPYLIIAAAALVYLLMENKRVRPT